MLLLLELHSTAVFSSTPSEMEEDDYVNVDFYARRLNLKTESIIVSLGSNHTLFLMVNPDRTSGPAATFERVRNYVQDDVRRVIDAQGIGTVGLGLLACD